ncbi:HpcH/HpaI aldolase family protein [Paenibacillus thalictri]|uniref:Aldolase n=1 Tax=Paenibacillus thalictri TaxID=2527873 RepID=A0A4Q9DTM5_9BACL|nr:aldolase/citrate lyase family protein [Paenibacillus thalictri]TBL79050.1 aldolase [Paenibacillus thalictri]
MAYINQVAGAEMDNLSKYLKKSVILQKLRRNELVNCLKLNVSNQAAFEIAAMSGIDSTWVCREHVANDWEMIERCSVVAKLYGCDLIVRVEKGSYSDYVKPLELDVTGIMVPHVKSGEEAAEIVNNTRFWPLGRRAWDGGNADGKYCAIGTEEYMNYSNSEKLIIVQIENPEGVEAIEDICSVDGIDMIFFGPGDLSQAYGVPGQLTHPKLLAARKKVADCALRHGKFLGTVTTPEIIQGVIADGYRFLNIGADVHALRESYGAAIRSFSDLR